MIVKLTVWSRLLVLTLSPFIVTGLTANFGCGKRGDEQAAREEAERMLPEEAVSQPGGEKVIVKKGDRVSIAYKGILNDGSVFDESLEGEPLEFVVGSGQVIPGFDEAVEGMKLNEKKTVTIESKDAYGARDEELIRPFARSSLPPDFKPEKGMQIGVQDQSGRRIPAMIADVSEDSVIVDFNHSLAGEDLTFELEVIAIQ